MPGADGDAPVVEAHVVLRHRTPGAALGDVADLVAGDVAELGARVRLHELHAEAFAELPGQPARRRTAVRPGHPVCAIVRPRRCPQQDRRDRPHEVERGHPLRAAQLPERRRGEPRYGHQPGPTDQSGEQAGVPDVDVVPRERVVEHVGRAVPQGGTDAPGVPHPGEVGQQDAFGAAGRARGAHHQCRVAGSGQCAERPGPQLVEVAGPSPVVHGPHDRGDGRQPGVVGESAGADDGDPGGRRGSAVDGDGNLDQARTGDSGQHLHERGSGAQAGQDRFAGSQAQCRRVQEPGDPLRGGKQRAGGQFPAPRAGEGGYDRAGIGGGAPDQDVDERFRVVDDPDHEWVVLSADNGSVRFTVSSPRRFRRTRSWVGHRGGSTRADHLPDRVRRRAARNGSARRAFPAGAG